MRWRLTCEECGPTLVHSKGNKNVVAGALGRPHLEPTPTSQCDKSALDTLDTRKLAESFLADTHVDDPPKWTIPASCKLLHEEQRKDKSLRKDFEINENNSHKIKSFSADSSTVHKLITHEDKICVPKTLKKHVVQWYHEVLCHPGECSQKKPYGYLG